MSVSPEPVRIDKWLWAIRIYKTRSIATTACRNGRVTVAGQPMKASHEVKMGEIILAKNGVITRTVKVIGFLHQRVGAAAVNKFMEDLTPASEYEKLKEPVLQPLFYRPKGAGRPTKKDRRTMNQLGDLFQPE
jgi:ribosome-associated heat shock protein Hsp15